MRSQVSLQVFAIDVHSALLLHVVVISRASARSIALAEESVRLANKINAKAKIYM